MHDLRGDRCSRAEQQGGGDDGWRELRMRSVQIILPSRRVFRSSVAAASSAAFASTHCSPAGRSSSFQNGALGFQIIHQEFGGLERRLPVRRGGDDKHDIVAGHEAAIAVNDGDAEQRPARCASATWRAISSSAMPG